MFWVSEQRPVDHANTIWMNSYMTEIKIEELERTLAQKDRGNNLGEVTDILTALEADEEIGNLQEEEVAIIEKIAELLERRQKDKLPALRHIQKKKLLDKTTKVDKVLCKLKTHSTTKTDELFYAGAVVGTKRLEVKINKETERKTPM